jgi:ABC-type branched-subunit amino acid transport system substrate-binding protein
VSCAGRADRGRRVASDRPGQGFLALRQPRSRPAARQAVITGNFGNDLTLLVKAAKDVGFEGKFYTFYGNALGAPAAIGDAGIGKVLAVADWLPNVQTRRARRFTNHFASAFPTRQMTMFTCACNDDRVADASD